MNFECEVLFRFEIFYVRFLKAKLIKYFKYLKFLKSNLRKCFIRFFMHIILKYLNKRIWDLNFWFFVVS